jgi:hypothetical protein
MITITNKWDRLNEEQKDRLESIPYGWMVRNLLKYGNALISEKVIKEVGINRLVQALQEEFEMIGYQDAEVYAEKKWDIESGGSDYIAYVRYLSEKF